MMNPEINIVKPGDTVRIHSGPHKGQTGTVVSVDWHGYLSRLHATVWVKFAPGIVDGCALRNVEKVKKTPADDDPDAQEEEGAVSVRRKIEIFSAGCPVCAEAIELVRSIADPSCEIEVLDMHQDEVASKAKEYGVRSVPAVAIDGKLADCCAGGGIEESSLRAGGVNMPCA
jgi:glutaredoxin 3